MSDFIERARALDAAATAGPWEYMTNETPDGENLYFTIEDSEEESVAETNGSYQGRADAEFIAHARTALPQAVAALRAVTDLHQPRNTVTRSASGHLVDTPGPCTACDWDWPCPTVTSIEETLGEP